MHYFFSFHLATHFHQIETRWDLFWVTTATWGSNLFRVTHWFVLAAELANRRAGKYYGITEQKHKGTTAS